MSEKSELNVNDKDVAVPGEVLATGMEYLPSYGTYRAGDDILASRLGLVTIEGKVIKLVPLSGKYLPKRGDVIIARVEEILLAGWRLDTNSAYSAVLPLKDASSDFIARGEDLTKYFEIGDFVMAKITNVTSQNLVDITMKGPGLRKLRGGRIITVQPTKVPRIIGKKGSMVTLIKEYTGCRILVGQNGLVWIQGENPDMELLTVKVVEKIERESHLSGLTENVKQYLEKHAKSE
jgi:exosome complex component RRP4